MATTQTFFTCARLCFTANNNVLLKRGTAGSCTALHFTAVATYESKNAVFDFTQNYGDSDKRLPAPLAIGRNVKEETFAVGCGVYPGIVKGCSIQDKCESGRQFCIIHFEVYSSIFYSTYLNLLRTEAGCDQKNEQYKSVFSHKKRL